MEKICAVHDYAESIEIKDAETQALLRQEPIVLGV
jgi:hypothetical protein